MGLGSILGDIISPLSGATGGGSSKGGSNSILSLLTSLIGGGTGGSAGAGSTILPAALNMLFSGGSNQDSIPAPVGSSGAGGMMAPKQTTPMGQTSQNGVMSLQPSDFGSTFTPMAPPKISHAMAWYAGDPNAPMQTPDASAMPAPKKPTANPYDFSSYFGGQ